MSKTDAVTTMALVLNEWMNKVTGEEPTTNMIYDEQLSLETALTSVRKKMERDKAAGKLKAGAKEFPLLAFKRSHMEFPNFGMGRRSQVLRVYQTEKGDADKPVQKPVFYKPIYGLLKVPFMYCTETMRDEEQFEIEFLAEDQLSSIKEVKVKIPDIGDFDYFVQYSAVEAKTVQSKDMYYKVVQGTVSFLGWYVVLEGRGSIITEIHAKINDFKSATMAEIDIVANTLP